MPYIPKAKREEQEWMTLTETISHIRSNERCDEAAALHQLREALADDEIAACIKTCATSTFYGLGLVSELDPHSRRTFWLSVPLDLDGDGYVATVVPEELERARQLHAAEEQSGGATRTRPEVVTACGDGEQDDENDDPIPHRLFLERASVLVIWDTSLSCSEDKTTSEQERQDRRPASKQAIRVAAREVYTRATRKAPNVNEAKPLIDEVLRAKSMKAGRSLVREILNEPEFATKRLSQGERP